MKKGFYFLGKNWEFSGTLGRVLRFSWIQTPYQPCDRVSYRILENVYTLRFCEIGDINGFGRPVGGIKKEWARLINEMALATIKMTIEIWIIVHSSSVYRLCFVHYRKPEQIRRVFMYFCP